MSEAELLETMVNRLLEEGVPTEVISRAFQLDIELLKERQSQVRKNRYGTDDLSEYIEHLRWTALESALTTVTSGSVADKTRFLSAILGKEMAVSARRTPESQRKAVDSVMDMMAEMRKGPNKTDAPRSRFVAVMGGDNAVARPLADVGDPDDQDEIGEAAQAE